LWARECRRLGIPADWSLCRARSGICSSARVGMHSAGNSSALPGMVTYVWPDGDVEMTVASGNCCPRQP
jgi:hypothetical protein